jgi:spore coat protein U-like protein
MSLARALQVAALLCLPVAAHAACTVNVTGVNFGVYNTFTVTDTLSTGSVDVRCTPKVAFTVAMSTGAGSYTSRQLISGSHQLPYNLYLDASRVTIWGNGTGGTGIISDNASKGTYTIYGRIPARQNAYVGSYADTIVVTVTF